MNWIQFEMPPPAWQYFGDGEAKCCPEVDSSLFFWVRQLGMPRILEVTVILIVSLCTVLLLVCLIDFLASVLQREVRWREINTYFPVTTKLFFRR
jgi:hypothetical protein